MIKSASAATKLWRLLRLALHLGLGVGATLLVFPLLPRQARQRVRQVWSKRLIEVLCMRIESTGWESLPDGCLIAANHVSWVDVFAINALIPVAFVAKSDVRTWPLIGWLAARNDTLFLRRDSRSHARIVNRVIANTMAKGHHVALFPEGTSTDGSNVRAFHGALFQPAIAAERPVVPIAIRYELPDGARSTAAAYAGDTTMWQSICSIIGTSGLCVRVTVCSPLSSVDVDRKSLVSQTHAAIVHALSEPDKNDLCQAA